MRKNTVRFLLFVVACTIGTVVIFVQGRHAQTRQEDSTVPAAQVNEAIQTFAGMVNGGNIQSFGLQSIAQLKSMRAGKQFKKYMIGLDDIRKYKTGDNADALIKELPSIEVALVNETGRIQTSIEFEMKGGRWVASGFGLTPDLATLREAQPTLAENAVNDGRLIRVPSLRINFLAVSSPTGTSFVALVDNDALGFKRGAAVSSAEALSRLVGAANLYNGLPD